MIRVLPHQPAGLPAAPKQGSVRLYFVLGLVAGLVIGRGIAVVRHLFNVKVPSEKDVEKFTACGVMAVTPEGRPPTEQLKSGGRSVSGIATRALLQLRTNPRLVNSDQASRALAITSANPGKGKSTVCACLIRALPGSGQATVLVLRRIPPKPSGFLGSVRTCNLIFALTTEASYFVVLDVPPLLAVTEAGLVVISADGVILVILVGCTHKEQVVPCTKRLDQVGGVLLDSVLTRALRNAMADVLYGCGDRSAGYFSYGTYFTYKNGMSKHTQKRANLQNDYFRTMEPAPISGVRSPGSLT